MTAATGADEVRILVGVWDNIDLLECWLEHHRRLGFAGVVAMDFGSVDGSAELLSSAEWSAFVELVAFPGITEDTNGALLEHARECGLPGWVLLCDPDEFLDAPGGLRHGELAAAMAANDLVVVPRFHFAAPREAVERDPTLGVNAASLRFIEQDMTKVMVRLGSDVHTDLSGHEGDAARAVEVAPSVASLLHVPVRSFEKFREKVDHAAETLAANPELPAEWGWHWRRWVQMRDAGELYEEYLRRFPAAADLPGAYVRDDRLADLRC